MQQESNGTKIITSKQLSDFQKRIKINGERLGTKFSNKPTHTREPENELTLNQKNSFLQVKPVNTWVQQAKLKKDPKMLFGSFWYEGEVCILFAGSNTGKSIAAVQIAEGIARGKSALPALTTVDTPKKVLYIDCELSDKQ